MTKRDRPHLLIESPPNAEPFTRAVSGRGNAGAGFKGDRNAHVNKLIAQYEDATEVPSDEDGASSGTYVTFTLFPGAAEVFESLESTKPGDQPQLLAVTVDDSGDEPVTMASVFVPYGRTQFLVKKLEAYQQSIGGKKPDNAKLVEAIAEIGKATIRSLWTDGPLSFPDDPHEHCWWEVWLRKRDGHEESRFRVVAEELGWPISNRYLGFHDRTILLVKTSAQELGAALFVIDDLAELRKPRQLTGFLAELSAREQAEWVEELVGRLTVSDPDAPAVCILDTGIQGSHPLLKDSLEEEDVHVVEPDWRRLQLIHGHGTEMAGLALFGSLHDAVNSRIPIRLGHRLESVRILRDPFGNAPELYGEITARAVTRPEIQAPLRPRVFMMAVSAPLPRVDGRTPADLCGKPTSWSAAVDALAFGRQVRANDESGLTYLDREEPPEPRLLVLSAGNVIPKATEDYLAICQAEPIDDPGQAWNALTVGAYSGVDDMAGASPGHAGYVPIAPRGDLSPASKTSVPFDPRRWPIKPEVVADGGNHAVSPDGFSVDTPETLSLLTTRFRKSRGDGYFTSTRDTSAATAQVAAIAADIWAEYPNLWPETVRALIVHSAEWTPAMKQHFHYRNTKGDLALRRRRYGMGVPDRVRALRSASDALTLVAQAAIHPYTLDGSVHEMNLHELPWPVEELRQLLDQEVRLRVTLSHFVEPNPSARGWTGRYTYASHGLRFDMPRPTETLEQFRERINKKARDDDYVNIRSVDDKGWLFGADSHDKPGSLHTDIWSGTAAELADMKAVAVYPVTGWWKGRRNLDQSARGVRYSLVVGIEAPESEIDLWAAVANRIKATTMVGIRT